MKKVISLMLALVLALSLTACGGKASGPEGVVGQFCKGLQELDEKAIAQCFENGDDLELSDLEDVDSDEAVTQKIMDFMKSCAGRLKYQVGEATVVLGGKAQELLTGKAWWTPWHTISLSSTSWATSLWPPLFCSPA